MFGWVVFLEFRGLVIWVCFVSGSIGVDFGLIWCFCVLFFLGGYLVFGLLRTGFCKFRYFGWVLVVGFVLSVDF